MKKLLLSIFMLAALSLSAQVQSIPYTETFEGFTAFTTPGSGWQGGFQVYLTHGTGSSKGLIKNLNNFTTKDSATTPKMGVVTATSWLKFDYRIVEFSLYPSTATVLTQGDMLKVSVSANGGAFTEVMTIDQSNHITSTSFVTDSVDISQFAGDSIRIKFAVKRGSTGDYFVDLDNIKVTGTTVVPTGLNESNAANFKIYPNPAKGSFVVQSKGNITNEISVELFNMLGQKVVSQKMVPGSNGAAMVDVSSIAKGLYVVSVEEGKRTYKQKMLIVE